MDDEQLDRENQLLTTMADMQGEADRRYESLSKRMQRLEDSVKGTFEDDPLKAITGIIVTMIVIQMVLPLVTDLIQRWAASKEKS